MLTMMRNLLSSKLGLGLFGLIIIAMAGWGVTDIFSGGLGTNLAKAGSRELTLERFETQVEQYLRVQRQSGGEIVSRRDAVEQGVMDQLFNIEVARSAVLGFGERIGANASDSRVEEEIRGIEAFQSPATGQYDHELYQRYVRQSNMSQSAFNESIRDDLTLGYLQEAATAATGVPDSFARLQATYLGESRKVAWMVLGRDDLDAPAPPTEDALRSHYAENTSTFEIPERRRIAQVRISPDDFRHKVEVDEEMLRSTYDAQLERRFSEPDSRRFLEIVATSEAAARDILGRLAAGAGPEDLADEQINSVQERTARRRDLASEVLAEELFGPRATPGIVAGPAKRGQVWLVARLEAVIPGDPIPFEYVRGDIRETYVTRAAEDLYRQAMDDLFDQIGAGLTLSQIARELGVPLMRLTPLGRNATVAGGEEMAGLVYSPEILSTAFKLDPGEVSDPIEPDTDEGQETLLVQVNEVLPARTPEFEDVRARVAEAVTAQNAREKLDKAAAQIKARIEEGETDLAAAAAELGVEVTRPDREITRSNYQIGLPSQALVPVFEGEAGDVIVSPAQQPGQQAIIVIEAAAQPDETELSVLAPVVEGEIASALESDLEAALQSEIRQAMTLETNPSALDAYKQSIMERQ